METGVWTKKQYFYLGGSPDALLINSETGEILKTVEIKCPFYGKEKSVKDLVTDKINSGRYNQFYLHMNPQTNEFFINKSHKYYCQVQGVMELVGTEFCDFVVATEVDTVIVSIKKDPAFVKDLFEKMRIFYFRYLLPNFCRADWKGIMEQGPDGSYIEISQEIYDLTYKLD